MIWKKYEMSKTKWVELSATIKNEESWDSSKVVSVVELGKLVKTPAILDEEGNIITEAVPSAKLSFDILWAEQEPSEFSAYSVNVEAGTEAHQFAGMQWTNS